MSLPPYCALREGDLEIRVKAVPGAKRDAIAGVLGDRLKVRVAQPPEGGRANEAIRALIAVRLGVPVREVELAQGAANPQKTLRIRGGAAEAERLAGRLGADEG